DSNGVCAARVPAVTPSAMNRRSDGETKRWRDGRPRPSKFVILSEAKDLLFCDPSAGPFLTSCSSTLEPALGGVEGVGFHGDVPRGPLSDTCHPPRFHQVTSPRSWNGTCGADTPVRDPVRQGPPAAF